MKSTNFTVDILLSAKNIGKQDQYNIHVHLHIVKNHAQIY